MDMQGNHLQTRRKFSKKTILLFVSLILVITVAISGTAAYLIASADKANAFDPGYVTCQINETYDSTTGVKSNVTVTNTGNTNAYIRAYVVVNYEVEVTKADGTTEWQVLEETPDLAAPSNVTVSNGAANTTTVTYGENNGYYIKWGHLTDSFLESSPEGWYYQDKVKAFFYNQIVPAGGTTENLILECGPDTGLPEGCRLSVELLASAIQAEGYNNDIRDVPVLENWITYSTYNADTSYPDPVS